MPELDDQLQEVWELVKELGALSRRLQEAADRAVEALSKDKRTT